MAVILRNGEDVASVTEAVNQSEQNVVDVKCPTQYICPMQVSYHY